jgi:hypothetical protein
MARPTDSIAALATLYGLPADPASVQQIVAGPGFTSHSKSGADFNARARDEENRAVAALYADEIEKVILWAEAVAGNAGVALDPGAKLIS